ncbi:MAG: TIM barrel protein [Lentisphaerae bacterium]|jgi:hydroxypyruvate isomerase|nr:TIM barrel protein [Lentisphaerota bacterium]
MPVDRNVKNYGAGMKVRVAAMSGWFPGLSNVEMVEQVAAYGYTAFENLGAGKWADKEAVKAKCEELGVKPGAISGGGTINGDGPVNLGNHAQFEAQIREAIRNAKALGSTCLVGLTGAVRERLSLERQMDNLVVAGKRVAPMLEDAGITLTFEMLNTLRSHPGYFLVYSDQGADLVDRIGSPNVKLLFDVFHQQISEGNVIDNLTKYAGEIGHFHFADNPGRHEPGTGELNYRNIFKAIAATGYTGIVSAEFSLTPGCTTDGVMRILAECATW